MVTMIDANTNTQPGIFTLQKGPTWRSFDRFKNQGAKELEQNVPLGHVAQLSVKGTDFVVMRAETWNQCYGLARDVSRFQRGIRLIQDAVKLLLRIKPDDTEGTSIAVDLLRQLTYEMPHLPTEPAPQRYVVFTEADRESVDDDLDFDVSSLTASHPSFEEE